MLARLERTAVRKMPPTLKSALRPPIRGAVTHRTRAGVQGRRPQGMADTMLLERKTVSIPRACELVGVSRRTIYNWIAGGKIQYVRTAGGSVRIFADTLWREPNSTTTPDADWNDRLRRGA